jgi:hypothetical protein
MRELAMSKPDSGRWRQLFLMLAVLFGGIVRFTPAILANSPINDGGMFYTMIEEIKANAFRLPAYTSYNHLNIPFAYPPLSLYAGALISALGVPTMAIMRWLPALISTLSILAFYWMARQVLESSSKAALGATIYALMPRSFSWYVMGGGLSRSFGILFLLLTCGAVWVMFTKPSRGHVLLAIVCGAAAVLSHPETGLHTLAACVLMLCFRGRTIRAARDALIVAVGVIVLTSPWWGSVLARHSLSTFESALQTGGHTGLLLIPWLRFDFSQEPFVALLTAIGMIGLVVQLMRGEWFLPAWTLVPFAVEPRSAPAAAILPLGMLASIGLADFVVPRLASLRDGAALAVQNWTAHLDCSRSARLVTAAIVLYALFGAFAYDLSLAQVVVPPASRAAMDWVAQSTAPGARFLVLTGSGDPFADPVAEWFPALTGRVSLNTLQGREWLLGREFMPFLDGLTGLQMCLNQGSDCLDAWARANGDAQYDYVYIQGPSSQSVGTSAPLARQLGGEPGYRLVFERDGVAVFARQ